MAFPEIPKRDSVMECTEEGTRMEGGVRTRGEPPLPQNSR